MSATPPRRLHLNVNAWLQGFAPSAWRVPENSPRGFVEHRALRADRAHRRGRPSSTRSSWPIRSASTASIRPDHGARAHRGADRGGRRHHPIGLIAHRLHQLQRALQHRAPLRLAGPGQRRARRLEHRHHADLRSARNYGLDASARPRPALPPRRRIHAGGQGAVEQLGRRRLRGRCRQRALRRPDKLRPSSIAANSSRCTAC